jgi:hypothetical protein
MPTQTPPISALYAVIACWSVQEGMPPQTLWEGETDEWHVVINATGEMQEGLPAFAMSLAHKTYMAFAVLDPTGGAVTGPSEDELIAHFNGLLKEPLEGVA